MEDMIQPRVLKGFRDSLPEAEIERAELADALVRVFRGMGFVPIDTPALEYAEILLGKCGGETEKQVYRFRDHGDREVALRFDLTVPFARFMAEHYGELYLPFKRYHIAKVWRGENTQRGRYREFTQCDFDIVGVDCPSADFDIMETICASMGALDVGDYSVRFNHRGIFNRFLESAGARDKSVDVLRIVDKLGKLGGDETGKLLAGFVGDATAGKILDFIRRENDSSATLEKITSLAGGKSEDSVRVAAVLGLAEATGIGQRVILDPSITRGLDYYTGVVFETFLDRLPEIGSVCSGGRYNDLASLYTRQKLPGVGASVGLDRLIAAMEVLGRSGSRSGYTKALILYSDDGSAGAYRKLAAELRACGTACEVYPERKKIAAQFAYAERKGISYGVMMGSEEAERGTFVVKNLVTRQSNEFSSASDAAAFIQRGA
ncbi:MAG: histidine--tRNA ligase [Spirochaetes bacterium]|nr:histidine--tRNA ligase [Spirochaetota bacterium]